jgi:hypothetical protein
MKNVNWPLVIFGVVVFLLIRGCMGCGGKQQSDLSDYERQKNLEQVSQIQTRYELKQMHTEDGKQKIVVWVTNSSVSTFNGDVTIGSYDVDGSVLGMDCASIDNLDANETKPVIVWLRVASIPSIKMDVSR